VLGAVETQGPSSSSDLFVLPFDPVMGPALSDSELSWSMSGAVVIRSASIPQTDPGELTLEFRPT
jgi:hypothetical protein